MLWVNPPVLYKANPLVHIPPSKDQNLEFLLIVGFGERCLFCFMNPVTVLISTPKKMLNIHTCLFERWLNFCLFVNKYFIPQNDVFWVPTTFFKFSTFWIRFQFLIIFGHAHPSTATWMKPFPAGMQWVKGAIQHVHHNIVLGQSDQPHKMWMNAVEETNNANLFRSQAFSFNSVKQWFHPWSFWLESGRGRLLVDLQCWRLQSCAGARSPLCRLHWIGIGEQGGAANLQPTYFILKPGSVATSLCIIACVMWQKPDPFWSVDLESSDFPAGQPETFLFPALHGECSGSFSGWARKRRPIPKASHWRTWVCLGVPKNFEEEGQGPEWPPPHPMARPSMSQASGPWFWTKQPWPV